MSELRIGFLAITTTKDRERIGGLLVTNQRGRPLEFHCTAPIKPNRAQEILYGNTFESYICGDRIGPALIKKLKTPVNMVVTDCKDAVQARHHVDVPVVVICDRGHHEDDLENLTTAEPSDHELFLHKEFSQDQGSVHDVIQAMDNWMIIDEPLERIRVAITEATRSAA